jgi:hypothetical protein
MVNPKRRKFLKYKQMNKLGLDDSKIQVLFILDNSNLHTYYNISENLNNSNVEMIIYSELEDFVKNEKFKYFNNQIDLLFEICNHCYDLNDDRVLCYGLDSVSSIQELNSLFKQEVLAKDDEVSIILAHCNTEEKLEILSECITTLKKQNQKIILSSHLKVPDEILDSVDYFVYDKKNEMIEPHEADGAGRTYAFVSYSGYYHEYNYDNHAFAVLKLMQNAVNLAHSNGFRVSHLIHYDCILYDETILKNHYNDLSLFDIIHYFYEGYDNRMDGNFFSIKTDLFLRLFFFFKHKSDFLNFGIAMFESFIRAICYTGNNKIKSDKIENLFHKNIIDKVTTLEIGIKKFYTEELFTHTFVIPSKDEQNKYLTVNTNDPDINYFLLNGQSFDINPNQIVVIKIPDKVWNDKFLVEIPQIEHKEVFDSNVKFADCLLCEPELLNFYEIKY